MDGCLWTGGGGRCVQATRQRKKESGSVLVQLNICLLVLQDPVHVPVTVREEVITEVCEGIRGRVRIEGLPLLLLAVLLEVGQVPGDLLPCPEAAVPGETQEVENSCSQDSSAERRSQEDEE